MSLLTSLSSGTTGLASASAELAVVGDNIANANTVGFKAQRANFEDQLSQSIYDGSGELGYGSHLQSIQKIMTEGALQSTGIATDLALQGSGFFEVAGTAADGRTGTYLTRAGQFTIDNNGYLVNQDGLRVQGYPATNGSVTSAAGDLQIGNASSPPNATANVTISGNLQADADVKVWDPTDPTGTSDFSAPVTIYDQLGSSQQAQVYFSRTAAGAWDWNAMVGGAGTPIASGTLTFDGNGILQGMTQNPGGPTFSFGTPGGTGDTGLTQFAGPSATTFVGQDGYGSGQLTSLQIDSKGMVMGTFTNGQTRTLGQVGVARVAAPDQLQRSGGNLYATTLASGQAVLGTAGDGGRALIASGVLEQSNVDIAEQFVRMIAAQRAFEANSKTITTADQLLSELIAMKR